MIYNELFPYVCFYIHSDSVHLSTYICCVSSRILQVMVIFGATLNQSFKSSPSHSEQQYQNSGSSLYPAHLMCVPLLHELFHRAKYTTATRKGSLQCMQGGIRSATAEPGVSIGAATCISSHVTPIAQFSSRTSSFNSAAALCSAA